MLDLQEHPARDSVDPTTTPRGSYLLYIFIVFGIPMLNGTSKANRWATSFCSKFYGIAQLLVDYALVLGSTLKQFSNITIFNISHFVLSYKIILNCFSFET